MQLQCKHCGHDWFRRSKKEPKNCPSCRKVLVRKERVSVFGFEKIKPGERRFYAMQDLMKIQNWVKIWEKEWRYAKRINKGLLNTGGFGGYWIIGG